MKERTIRALRRVRGHAVRLLNAGEALRDDDLRSLPFLTRVALLLMLGLAKTVARRMAVMPGITRVVTFKTETVPGTAPTHETIKISTGDYRTGGGISTRSVAPVTVGEMTKPLPFALFNLHGVEIKRFATEEAAWAYVAENGLDHDHFDVTAAREDVESIP